MPTRLILFAAALLALMAGRAPAAPAAPAPAPNEERILEGVLDEKGGAAKTDDKAEEDEGDKEEPAEFTIKTKTNIKGLADYDRYKSAGSEFVVTKIVERIEEGKKGGKFIIRRVAGSMDPDRRLVFSGVKPRDRKPPTFIAVTVSLLDLYIMGGEFLHPIALLAVLMIVLIANSLWIFRRSQQIPADFVAKARDLLSNGQIAEFEDLSLKRKGLFPTVCRAIADRFDISSTEDIQKRVEVVATGQISRLRLPVKLLNLIAAAAPLLGLLGTIIGMVIVFEAVASAQGAEKAASLAAGIRVKLFATATALMVAIPALFAYFIFNARLGGIIADSESLADEFLHYVALLKRGTNGDAHAQAPVRAPAAAAVTAREFRKVELDAEGESTAASDVAGPPPQPKAPVPTPRGIPTRRPGKEG
jgi:biopolymer transport protein ExbB